MPITIKNSVQLPEIGQIRKGDVKGENKPGADLKDRFRVLFFPGNEASAKLFVEKHPEEKLFPKRIKAMLPFPRLDDCWVVYNEAYSAGRMLARADGEKYITLRDGRTGEYIISDGKPYRPFKVGDTVNYTSSNGKAQSIKIKPVGKLYLFLPELDRAVYMTLKTTSFYDALNIEAQLGAIESIASGINHGSVMGVPIWIYRRPQYIAWNQPDGNAVRVEKWLINVEIDTEWIKSAANRMSRFALGGGDLPALPSSFGSDFDPNDEGDDIPDEAQEGSFVDAPQHEATPPTPDAKGETVDIRVMLSDMAKHSPTATDVEVQRLAAYMDKTLKNRDYRLQFLSWVQGKTVKSAKDLDKHLVKAIFDWLDITYDSNGGAFYAGNLDAEKAIIAAHTALLVTVGQETLI